MTRLSLSDAYADMVQVVQAALTRPPRHASEDVEIIENAKHELQVKISASRLEDETLAQTAERAWEVFRSTRARIDAEYPAPDTSEADAKRAVRAETAKVANISRRQARAKA